MKIEIDKEVDASYIYAKEEIGEGEVAKTIEVNGNIILDFDSGGKLIGIEILDASKNLSNKFLSSVVSAK
ncbi:MAG: DUF2283 domain-containing protein [Nanoarchaeota archaeon]|nr:DUF2283 domain-containing protein [Nanoarchaeota archaeon]MBU1103129.1 DUF2283 domain-containing protein [Nanoarchaeota archaeon]